MVEKTPRLNLDRYEPGDSEWNHSDLVDAVDELVEDRGTFSDRPDTGEYDGEKYHAKDRRIVYEWDESANSWQAIMGVGLEDKPLPGTVYRESVDADAIDGNPLIRLPTEWTKRGSVDRRLYGPIRDTTWYASPNGSIDAEGTQADPLSFEGVCQKLPRFIHGALTVDLHTVPSNNGNLPAVYDNGRNSYRPPVGYGATTYGEIKFVGNQTTPSEVQFTPAVNWAWYGKGDHGSFFGVQFNNSMQMNGFGRLKNCNIYQRGNNGTAGQAFGTKNGIILFDGCDIGEGNVVSPLKTVHNANIAIESTTITNDGTSGGELKLGTGTEVYMNSGTKIGRLGKNVENMSTSEFATIFGDCEQPSVIHDSVGRTAMESLNGIDFYTPDVTESV